MKLLRAAFLGSLILDLTSCGPPPESARQRKKATGQPAPDSLLAEGETHYKAERYDSARIAWKRALAATEGSHDEINRARALTSLGLVTGRLGDPREAERLGEEALAIKTRLGLATDMSSSFHALGLAALAADRNERARQLFQQALEAAKTSGDARGVAKALGGLGLAYAYLGDLTPSRVSQRAARSAARSIGDARLQANALANEAMVDIWEGNALPAIAILDTARELYRRDEYGAGEQNALGQLATAYELTGREDLALAALDSSLIICRRLRLKEQEAELLRLIGGVHLRLGDYRKALSHLTRAGSMMRAAGGVASLGSVLRGVAEAHLRLGDLPSANESLAHALRLHAASSEPLERLDDVLLAAEIDYRIAGSRRATARLDEGRILAERIHTRGARLAVLLTDAHLADISRDSRRVLRLFAAASPEFASGDLGAEWIANALRARAYGRLGELDSARATGRRAVAAVDRLRGTLASEALRSTYVADRSDVYGDLVVTLLRMRRPEEAFDVADAARSRNLLDRLSSTGPYATSGAIAPAVADGERLLQRIDALIQRLRATRRNKANERGTGSDAGGLPSVEAELEKARSEYEAVVTLEEQRNWRSTAILGARPAHISEVRASLGPDEALIEYMLIPDRLVAFVATHDSLHVAVTVLDGGVLVQRVRLLADLWGRNNPNWKLGVPASRALYKTLVGPILATGALRNIRHLVVVPHGILGQVAFAALENDLTGRFLVQDYSVISLPTAAALPALRRQESSLRDSDASGFGFAPFNGPNELPATESEIKAFRVSAPRRITRTGDDATEARLRLALSHTGIVHVATHGVMNLRSPLFSRVELAPTSGADPNNDGRLEVHELLRLSIRSSLVFLSGCETGAGVEWLNDPVRGTADLTLAQAVLSAGAANVITTLWRIADNGAARFAEAFYGNLRHLPIEEALAATQRAMAGDAEFQSPYYWAGTILSGGGRFSARPQAGTPVSVSNTSAR